MNHLLGYKKGMTQVYAGDEVVPVTIVEIPENTVSQVSASSDGDSSQVELGIGVKKNPTKAESGKYSRLEFVPEATWMFSAGDVGDVEVGKKLAAGEIKEGDEVKISGVTKAKGFAGVVKRWGFAGGPRTHGQSDRVRAPGSIGAGTDPGRVLPGRKMPGRMGGQTKTFDKRLVVDVGEDYILVKGSLPGSNGSLLKIEVTRRNEG